MYIVIFAPLLNDLLSDQVSSTKEDRGCCALGQHRATKKCSTAKQLVSGKESLQDHLDVLVCLYKRYHIGYRRIEPISVKSRTYLHRKVSECHTKRYITLRDYRYL